MRTELLIADLASRAGRVTPLRSPSVRWLGWSIVATASVAAALLVFGPRRNLAHVITQSWFLGSALLVAGTAAIAALTSLVLAVPGAARSSAMRASAFTLLAVWAALGIGSVIRTAHGLSDASDWYVCFMRVIGVGLIPAWVLFGMLWRALPLRVGSTGALAALGAMAIGSVTMQFVCPLDVPSHTFLGHLGPALALCGVGAIIGARPRAAARADRLD